MARISLAGFKDPVRRPRFIIWTGVVVLVLAAVVVVALGVTSTRWFCADACHKVQDDTIIAYSHSSHSEVSCMACHMPVNANPITFVLHKMKALGELYLTVTNRYELPLNIESELALNKEEMGSEKCTQCHSKNRLITPSRGIIIDHEVHAKKGVGCTFCHNRVAHKEDFDLTLPGNKGHKHPDFMKMDACFRCHGLESGAKAPGKCSACHPADFRLKPDNHLQAGFYPKGHAKMAKEDGEKVAEADKEAKGKAPEAAAEGGESLKSVGQVSYCGTCHMQKFCDNCHGMEMPHPTAFVEPTKKGDPNGHPAVSKVKADKCEFCHHQSKAFFCDNCHHGSYVKWTFNPKVKWDTQHASAVQKTGVKGCLGKCHEAKFCSDCHTARKPFPTSHKDPQWLHGPKPVVSTAKLETAKPSAKHVEAAKQPEDCAVCHGGDGSPKSPFCQGCHKLQMPHPQDFKKFHSKTGRAQAAACSNCHRWPELCSNCHHVGAQPGVAWVNQHGKTVNASGAAQCFTNCHKKDFCVNCHTARKVIPASHRAGDWLHRKKADVGALHTTSFQKSPDNCTYCHGDGGAKSVFCANCHKMDMPHPEGFTNDKGGQHKELINGKKLAKAACANCHNLDTFCNTCHHKEGGYKPGGGPWMVFRVKVPQQHPGAVKAKGAEGCFKCHKETFCSYCHVRAK